MSHEYTHRHIIHTDKPKNPLTLEALKQKDARSKFGCFTRAIESTLGEKATDGEWGFRLRHLKRTTVKKESNPRTNVAIDEQANIEAFFTHLAVSATPLGQAFRDFDFTETVLPGKQLKRLIRQGNRIILPIRVRDNNNRRRSEHFAQITRSPFGTLRRASDEGKPKIKLKNKLSIDVLVFSPKTKKAASS